MQDYVIQVRDEPCLAHWEDSDGVLETVIVPAELSLVCTEDRVVPMAHELDNKPERKDAQENPFPDRMDTIEQDQTGGVHAKHHKFSTLDPHAIHKNDLAGLVRNRASEKPYP